MKKGFHYCAGLGNYRADFEYRHCCRWSMVERDGADKFLVEQVILERRAFSLAIQPFRHSGLTFGLRISQDV